MTCYYPITAYRGHENEQGKRPLVFSAKESVAPDAPLEIACGQCWGCRLERSRVWAMRCMHESQMHEDNCFITLTFNNESLFARENPGSVDVRDFQLFMKRLRKVRNEKIRYFHCGEYGEKFSRPHYHAILFNCDFPDKILHSVINDNRLYTSAELDNLWGFGFASIGECTFESAAYVARYCMKKINGDLADDHYQWVDEETGELRPKNPEYSTMSRRPGIGKKWFDKYWTDIYPKDYITVNGVKCRPGKYYDGQLEITRPYEHEIIKQNREEVIRTSEKEDFERLLVKEQCHKARITKLYRKLD